MSSLPWVTIRYKPIPLDPSDSTWKVAVVVALCWGSFVLGVWTGGR